MRRSDFCCGWTYRHAEEGAPARPVTIPHDAMLAEPRSEQAAGGKNIGWFEGRDYIYEKIFSVEEAQLEQVTVLEFEGVYHRAEVYLNGERMLFRPFGYTNFYVDLTGRLRKGENVLQVRVRCSDQPNSRWYSGAGIYRPVWLWTAEAAYIPVNGVRIRTVQISPPAVEISVKTSQAGQIEAAVLEKGRILWEESAQTEGSVVLRAELPQAALWHPDAPALYTCRVRFADDEHVCSFGVRTIEWGENGFLLNGERVILQGACVHHDHGLLGACCYPEAEERRVRLLKETGYNALRSAHNPCSKALLDACDRQGMLVLDEYIDQWYIHKTEHDYVEYFGEWWRQDLADMVDKDYNHPCVVMYSIGNEVSETAQKRGIELTREMSGHLHALDESRPVTCGVNIFFNFLSSIGFGVYSDKKAAQEAKQAEKARRRPGRKKAVGSQFFNDMAGLLGDEFMKRGATLHGCDVKTRDAFAQMDIAGYNYGIYRYRHDLKKYPKRLILGSETFCSDAYRFRELAKQETRLIGDFVWAGMDYLGEAGVGAWEYRDYAPRFDGPGWITAGSGRLDLTGKPLGEALYTRIALEKENGVYIAVRPVRRRGERHSPSAWKMTNAIDSWSWSGCEGMRAHVEVYARAAKIALYLNGKMIGCKKVKNDCQAHFFLPYEAGRLEACAWDEAGREIGRAQLTSAGACSRIVLEPEVPCVRSGKLCYVRLRYADEAGITVPTERGMIQVKVEGGRLLGLGSACPYYPGSYLDERTDTYYGEALAVILPDGGKEVCIRADDGRYRAELSVPPGLETEG